MPSHYKFGLWDTAVLGLLLSLTDTSRSLRLQTPLASLRPFHLVFPCWVKTQYRSAFLPACLWHQQHGLLGSCTGRPCPPVQVAAGGHSFCCALWSSHLGRAWRLLLIKWMMEFEAAQTNPPRTSGLPLTELIYEGEQHSSFTCPISEALLL